MTFGNWTLNEKSLDFDNGKVDYSIWPLTTLQDKITVGDGDELGYNWPIHMAGKTWMTESDVEDFEKVFYAACERHNFPISETVKTNTAKVVDVVVGRKRQRG